MPRVATESSGRVLARAARALAARAGLVTVPSGIYCPVPEELPPSGDPAWLKPVRMHGVAFDTAAQLQFVRERLWAHMTEFTEQVRPAHPAGFELWNSQYMAGDAEILYAMLRMLRPRRVLEIGSGHSTLVAAAACARNGSEGHTAELVAVDPDPRLAISEDIEGLERVERMDCRELPLERFTELDARDVLFIDTSHIVKLGSEVNWLMLDVLPRLSPGVVVQVHDVYLPYEYHPHLFELGVSFNEQYLLRALLTENPGWEVMVAACALAREHRAALEELIPSLGEAVPGMPGFDYVPVAFWMGRR